jgi:ribosomal protein L37E
MNFKTTLLIAGALAVASANTEDMTNQMVEESSQALVERCSRASLSVNPSKCARCRGAPQRRAARLRQMYNWRNGQNRALSKWWSGRMAYRSRMMTYWRNTWWSAQVRAYNNRRNYINRTYASWYRTMQYNYNHCK